MFLDFIPCILQHKLLVLLKKMFLSHTQLSYPDFCMDIESGLKFKKIIILKRELKLQLQLKLNHVEGNRRGGRGKKAAEVDTEADNDEKIYRSNCGNNACGERLTWKR